MIHNTIQGQLAGNGLKVAIVVGRFNELISKSLLEGCVETLSRLGTLREDIAVFWAPGAFEIPFTATKLVALNQFDAVICLGAVIRGATPHFDYVAGECASGIAQLNREGKIPVIFGVLTTETIEQAIERAGTKAGNKGSDCALAAVEMANLSKAIDGFQTGFSSTNTSPRRTRQKA